MKPHIKVIQRNGVDIFVTSSMKDKPSKSEMTRNKRFYNAMRNAAHNHLITPQQAGQLPYKELAERQMKNINEILGMHK
tara:strand:+ start:1126 stop:1362 length:237 start_codon:yes stop_codon:yes gene_type:complete